jgi:hypothetical protein
MSENIVGTSRKRLRPDAAQLMGERHGSLPVWIRAPKRGPEFYSGFTRPKLYELAAKGRIRTCSVREPGRIRGTRLFDLQSILAFIESQCA